MCGITGIISKKNISSSLIKKMNDKIIHRGPDEAGFLLGGKCDIDIEMDKLQTTESPISFAFGHRRLSIVDLSPLGHQPMCFKDRYWIVYNGEVYNHIELRAELEENGYQFVSHTDTEVIMAAYDFWGADCLNKFNGMWAIVLYDIQKQEIFISRDRFGIKPIYYYQDENHFIFGSEIKSILVHPDVKAEHNMEFCNSYLHEGSKEYTKTTAFKNIFRFDFTSYYHCKIEDIFKPFKEVKFWAVEPNLSNEPFDKNKAEEYAVKYYEILNDAVKLRLRADVKVGSALSGGLDSSSIVYLVNQELRRQGNEKKQETFSTVYMTPGTEHCDESEFIDEIANKLQVTSHKIEPIEANVPQEHSKVIYAMENPPEGTLMSSWYTYKLISETDITVTLDGQGADEQLGGYQPYIIHYWATKSLKNLLKDLKLFRRTNTLKFALIGLSFNLCSRLVGEKIVTSLTSRLLGKKVNYFQHLNERLNYDMFTHLITLIHFADHTSMAHSIESRMPFMDFRLVEFLSGLPASYKIHNGWTKYIARLAFDKKLPDTITWRKDKMGWPIPEKKWFAGSLKFWYLDEIKNAEKLLHRNIDLVSTSHSKSVRYLNYSIFNRIFFKD